MKPRARYFSISKASSRGAALLVAVLSSSMLLLVGTALASIVLKEAVLSETTAESLRAIYAADAGADCGFYWDISENALDPYTAGSVSCLGVTHSFSALASGSWTNISSASWQFDFDTPSYCVTLIINKSGTPTSTTIESRGINTCDTSRPRRVERAIEITY